MIGQRQVVRLFHCSASVGKSYLAKLRKKTGYAISNCKKALDLHGNDVEKAEKWLHDQAQAHGWSKATSLGGRKTSQGVVALLINNKQAAMVELNCETDFVSNNDHFKSLADTVAKSCLLSVPAFCPKNGPVSKALLNREKLASIAAADGKTLADHVAMAIGLVRENMTLKRGTFFNAADNVHLAGYSHPFVNIKDKEYPMLGKYAAVVAVRNQTSAPLSTEKLELARQLCQHIVGMNPSRIGDPEKDKPCKNIDDETVMIYQEFLPDPSVTVQDILKDAELEVIDFARYECGEETVEHSETESAAVSAAA